MCAIDGRMSVALVPHINRQEVYSGMVLAGNPHAEETYEKENDLFNKNSNYT